MEPPFNSLTVTAPPLPLEPPEPPTEIPPTNPATPVPPRPPPPPTLWAKMPAELMPSVVIAALEWVTLTVPPLPVLPEVPPTRTETLL